MHPVCSLFASIDLADEVVVEPTEPARTPSTARACPGDNLAARALAEFRSRAGGELPPLAHHDREADPGGRRPRRRERRRRRGPARRQPARRRPARREELRALAAGLGSDVPSQVEPRHALVAGRGRARRAGRACRRSRAVLVPDAEGLSTAAVYAEFDRLDGRRARLDPAPLRSARAAPSTAGCATALENDLAARGAVAAPGARASALDAPARGRRARRRRQRLRAPPASACSPIAPRAERGRRALPGALVDRAALTYAVRVAMSAREMVAAVVAVLRRGVRRLALAPAERRAQGALRRSPCSRSAVYASGVLSALPDPKKSIEDIGRGARPVDLRARRRAGVPRDRRVRRARRAGRDDRDRRRRDRRPGRDRPDPADRARLGLRGARRHHELLHRPPARPQLPRAPRPEGEDHPRAARAGRGLLRPPRRQDDPDRPLHRARPRARAVHRRRVGLAYRRFIPYSIVGAGAVGHALLRPRLHLLALVRQGRARRRAGDVRLRGHGRA